MESPVFVLLIDCPDEIGLVFKITGVLYRMEVNVIGNQEFVESENNRFFMRTTFAGQVNEAEVLRKLRRVQIGRAHV